MKTYTPQEAEKLFTRFTKSGNCSGLLANADWNGNFSVTGIDLVLAQNYIVTDFHVLPTPNLQYPSIVING